MNNKLLICADDFAEDEPISEGILLAANKKRINAISCLVTSQQWQVFYQALVPLKKTVKIGLHFNLTLGQPISQQWCKAYSPHFNPLAWLIRKTFLKQLSLSLVQVELSSQIEAFTDAMGFYPDFIDGHQHIHQFPIIRNALLREAVLHPSFYRSTSNHYQDLFSFCGFPKQQIIALLGGFYFKKMLLKQGIPTNNHFAGIYNFTKAADYRYYFQKFLKKCRLGGLIMCHPGLPSQNKRDPLHPYRHLELSYLLSDNFLLDLAPYTETLYVNP